MNLPILFYKASEYVTAQIGCKEVDMDVRTEATRFASERINRTAENKDGFRHNSENRGKKKGKKNKRTQEDANGGIVDVIV